MDSPLESTKGWYDLPAVAEAAPIDFLQAAWDWLVATCEKYHSDRGSSVLHYYVGSCLALDDRPHHPEAPVLTAFCNAIDLAATNNPEEFLALTKKSWSSENAILHRLIVRGLCVIVKTKPRIGLEYLIGDPRRLNLGSSLSSRQSDSVHLIKELAPQLGPEERLQLEDLIKAWSMYRDGVEIDNDRDECNREARLRLLDAIPKAFLSTATSNLMHREKIALPHWDEKYSRSHSGFVHQIPPLSKEELLTATDDEVLKAMSAPEPDRARRNSIEVEGGWEELGGAESAAVELAELAKDHPHRVIQLAEMLVRSGKGDAAAHTMHKLTDSSLTDDEAFAFVRKLAALDATSEELRSQVSYLLYRRSKLPNGLPDHLCELLKVWLAMPWDNTYGIFRESSSDKREDTPERVDSVLWAYSGGLVDTDRSFWTLMAITQGYLSRKNPNPKAWLDVLNEHLDRDISDRTWTAYCSEFRWVRISGCDRVKGAEIIIKLFTRFPNLSERQEGIRLIANTSDILAAEFLQRFLEELRSSTSYKCRQAFGELLTLIAFRDSNHSWASRLLNEEILQASTIAKEEAVAVGTAFAAAQLWDEPTVRSEASHVLCMLIPHSNDRISQAIGSVFWAREDFVADEAAQSLLQAISNYPASLAKVSVTDLVEHLAGLLPHKRNVVLSVCKAILKSGRREHDLYDAGPNLVKIAMTLQRFPDTRAEGLSLLEALLRLGLDDAFNILRDIDVQPAVTRTRPPRLRRRRKRK